MSLKQSRTTAKPEKKADTKRIQPGEETVEESTETTRAGEERRESKSGNVEPGRSSQFSRFTPRRSRWTGGGSTFGGGSYWEKWSDVGKLMALPSMVGPVLQRYGLESGA